MDSLDHDFTKSIDYRQLGDGTNDHVIVFDADFRYIYINPPVAQMVGIPREQFLGRTIWEVAPHMRGTIYDENYCRAMQERVTIEFEAYYPPRNRWNHVRCVPESGGGLIIFARNTTEEHQAQQEREAALEALRISEIQARRVADILDVVGDAYITLDTNFCITYANAEAVRINEKPLESFLGRSHWEEWPASVGTAIEETYRRVFLSRVSEHFEHRYYVPGEYDVSLAISAYPDEQGGGLHVVYRDITERKRIEARNVSLVMALIQSEQDQRELADAMPQIVFTADATTGQIIYINRRWHDYVGTALTDPNTVWLDVIHPEDRPALVETWQQAFTTGVVWEFEYRLRRHDGAWRWHLGRSVPIREPNTGEILRWVGTATDIEAQKRAEEEKLQFSDLLRQSQDALIIRDLEGTIFDMNPAAENLYGFSIEEARGRNIHNLLLNVFPEGREAYETALQRDGQWAGIVAQRRKDGGEVIVSSRQTLRLGSNGEKAMVLASNRDITERRRIQERTQFLAELTDRTRFLLDPNAVVKETLKAVSGFLRLSRYVYSEVNISTGIVTAKQEFFYGQSTDTNVRTWSLSAISSLVEELRAGVTTVNRDTVTDPRTAEQYETVYRPANVRAVVSVPLLRSGEWVGYFSATTTIPRDWKNEEIALLEAVAERMWSAMENARLYKIMQEDVEERRLAEQRLAEAYSRERSRAEREALLNQIGAAVRASSPPTAIISVAIQALGKILNVDRCYLATVDTLHKVIHIEQDYCVEGIPSLVGQYRLSDLPVEVDRLFAAGETLVVADTQAVESPDVPWGQELADILAQLGERSLVLVPFQETGRLIATLGVAMASEPRDWTPEEVSLVETVANETIEAVETARLQQREHNIAEQLQKALVPEIPHSMPGLSLQSFYRAALEEAGVGGDFTDVFPTQDGKLTCFVVADLSGKGLAAASQVSTVRNMLRFALHASSSLVQAVTRLNQVLVEQNLLSGFATLFVGMYDAGTGSLTYVNCGQEEGLIYRAKNSRIDLLPATGPILGSFIAGTYSEVTVTLEEGDVIALFTDGMTEIGPNRRLLLGIEGLTTLLTECCMTERTNTSSTQYAQRIIDDLIIGVEKYAGGSARIRDDIALLVGVFTNSK